MNTTPAATNTAGAESGMTDKQIIKVWQDMPGGPGGWLKHFGFIQFARAVLAAAPVPCATDLLEEIAQSWDGCEYPDAMITDIGAALRHDFARFTAAPSAPVGAATMSEPGLLHKDTRLLHNGGASVDTPAVRALLTELAAWTGAGGMVKANEFVGRAAAAISHSGEGEKGGAA